MPTRAAELLADRLGVPADGGAVAELSRVGLIPRTGSYKGHALYDALAREQFTDRAGQEWAHRDGRLLDRCAAARHLGGRDVDWDQVVRLGWIAPSARWLPSVGGLADWRAVAPSPRAAALRSPPVASSAVVGRIPR
ncbi:hypothetical protein WDV06_10980 [Streptomyces racemochromogenes]|uniref:Uncharacterized protein n=1 Tax=Streptomyces racemochromogenes TaxID=67353 RepID=A0ABW7PB63_9ACTN